MLIFLIISSINQNLFIHFLIVKRGIKQFKKQNSLYHWLSTYEIYKDW